MLNQQRGDEDNSNANARGSENATRRATWWTAAGTIVLAATNIIYIFFQYYQTAKSAENNSIQIQAFLFNNRSFVYMGNTPIQADRPKGLYYPTIIIKNSGSTATRYLKIRSGWSWNVADIDAFFSDNHKNNLFRTFIGPHEIASWSLGGDPVSYEYMQKFLSNSIFYQYAEAYYYDATDTKKPRHTEYCESVRPRSFSTDLTQVYSDIAQCPGNPHFCADDECNDWQPPPGFYK